ncbi:hypothetical protein VE01_10000 [Pseudogymnoascus verrucosus]|uniref:BSD domain-containing protein n=1 Tax=Pseudogymnoascus verrucosus TaxID=342668 RepID=A0A1B8G8T5_9PEZI|nr:uncharacterized protein VE01_10000 [Pseudogymnoascus verrucosus]OBT92221.1 hypothetical protein VE01_10000 [Pseudogymnoascus verrucosus]
MDAYDHIQESALAPDEPSSAAGNNGANGEGGKQTAQNTLNADFQDAYKAISSSPWGARLGGFFGSVVKQGEHVYKEASQELSAVGQEATKGLADLRSSLVGQAKKSDPSTSDDTTTTKDGETPTAKDGEPTTATPSEGVLARLRTEAAKRLKDIERAEDAADEALLRFGTGLRDFLREAVSIAPAGTEEGGQEGGFESKDAAGKRVIHSTRFEAQMHAIHCNADSFTKDPEGEEWAEWRKEFDAEARTGEVSADLERFGELRGMMERLVPGEVRYEEFWARYYFLRHSIETAEKRRKELLKGAAADAEEEVGWDEDSGDEATPASASASAAATKNKPTSSVASSQTINPPAAPPRDDSRLDPADAKRKTSADGRSVADSEASYDVVGARSGVPSAAPGSPRQEGKKGEESDEDWE